MRELVRRDAYASKGDISSGENVPPIIEYIRADSRSLEECLRAPILPHSFFFSTSPGFAQWLIPPFQAWLLSGALVEPVSGDLIGGISGAFLAFIAIVRYAQNVGALGPRAIPGQIRWNFSENEHNLLKLCCEFLETQLSASIVRRTTENMTRSQLMSRAEPWVPMATFVASLTGPETRVKRQAWVITQDASPPGASHVSQFWFIPQSTVC